MNRTAFTLLSLLLLLPAFTWAQQRSSDRSLRYFNQTDVGFAFGVGKYETDQYPTYRYKVKNDEIIFDLHTINGFSYRDRVYVGLGVGAEKWSDGLFFPVYGHITATLKPRDDTFIASLGVGSAIGSRDSTTYHQEGTGSLRVQVGIGYRKRVTEKIFFLFEFYYRYQALHSSYLVFPNDSTQRVADYKVPLNFIGFRVGIQFP